ncbi:N-terminal cleavage protein [Opitutaceae bacterium TAV5]|nr:N-terminal cleavage protein [Opitutaceae bacterium TAV5]
MFATLLSRSSFTLSGASGRSRAFTLVELLTVIAIIGILAAIIIPVVGKVRQTAQAAVCASNFRQIGIGMVLYAQDNKDNLPVHSDAGTLTIGQSPSYGTEGNSKKRLPLLLAPYLNTPTATRNSDSDATKMHWSPLFACPAWMTARNPSTTAVIPSVSLTKRATLTSGESVTEGGLYKYGVKFSDILQPAQTWFFIDADAVTFGSGNDVPRSPVHGNNRNVLYFDGHVGKISTKYTRTQLDNLNKKL